MTPWRTRGGDDERNQPEEDAMMNEKTGGRGGLPIPADAPVLSLEDVAGYLRRSVPAVRKLLHDRANSGRHSGGSS